MGPALEETREGGPTKPSDKMETKLPEQSKQIISTDHPSIKPSTQPSSQLMMELPNPLKESFNKIYQGLEGIAKYIASVEKKTDEALHRVSKVEGRVGGLEDRINKAEEKIGKLEENVNNLEKYVNEQLGDIAQALKKALEAIEEVSGAWYIATEVPPGTPGAIPVEIKGEVKYLKLELVHDKMGNYPPVKKNLEESRKYMKSFVERALKKYENKYAKSS